jgi:hypothetical protein
MKMEIDFKKISRIEIINRGVERLFIIRKPVITALVQDDGRTLKIFVDKKRNDNDSQ